MSQNSLKRAQSAYVIDLKHFILGLRKILWQVVLLCFIFALIGFLYSHFSYVPTYTSETTLVVSNKTGGVLNESGTLTLSDIGASNALTNTLKYILLSDDVLNSIIIAYNLDLTINRLKGFISITPVPDTNILKMKVVTRNAALSRDISDRILQYYPEVLAKTVKYASLEVLNSPQVAQEADSYNGNITYPLLGLLLAFIITVIYICIKLVFYDTIKTISDISDKIGMNVLASIPKVRSSIRKRKYQTGLYITDKLNGFAFTESFRTLRTKIEMIAEKSDYKTFVVTSSLENEGKTTVAVNLSIALASNGRKVLLIDADLRKPAIYKFFGKSRRVPEFGLDSVLKGDVAPESAIMNIEEFGFSALLGVNEFPNSSELLSSAKIKDLISWASHQYEYIIIDSPPASLLTDSVIMTSYTDAVILTLRQDYAPCQLIDNVAQSLSENRADVVGCIFNIVDERSNNYGYYSYRRYGNYGYYGNHKKTRDVLRLLNRVNNRSNKLE